MTTQTTTHEIDVDGLGPVAVTLTESGAGRPVLLLHGGGGPLTVTPFAERLAERLAGSPGAQTRVLTPIHPGFDGTARPEGLTDIGGLARVYARLLESLDLHDVTVVGNSIGGWIAAEMAVLGLARVSRFVLVDAVGIEVDGHPVADFFSLTPAQVAERAYYDPATYGVDPTTLPPAAQRTMAGNREVLAIYAGTGMNDPSLRARLGAVHTPTLVVWGEADRIGDPDFGRAFANAIPGAEFRLLPRAGHMPQIETPDALIDVVAAFAFADRDATSGPAA